MTGTPAPRPGLLAAFTSWRLGAIALLSISSGAPLALVITTIPFWLTQRGVDMKTVGLVTVAQLPYGLKFVWSPLMDRIRPKFIGHRRAWVLLCQLALAAGTALLGTQVVSFDVGVMSALALLISFASASQDIAYDAYAVEVLTKDEHGPAVGVRSAMYRVGMWLSGNVAIWFSDLLGWPLTIAILTGIFLALIPVTLFAPDPPPQPEAPKTLREAVWLPFVGFLGRPRALELLAFVILFRLTDSLADALVTPFLTQLGFTPAVIGVKRGIISMAGNIAGTFAGGLMVQRIGISRTLWICALLQPLSNLGYVVVASNPQSELILYGALALETSVTGLTWGGFGVLLLRLTDKRFSATQYALFSSLVGLARTFMGPVAGVMVDAIGWRDFFILTLPFAIPGTFLLWRFCKWGEEPKELSGDDFSTLPPGPPWGKATLWALGLFTMGAAAIGTFCTTVALSGVKLRRQGKPFDYLEALERALAPAKAAEATDLIGAVVFGVVAGVAVAAYLAAKGRPARYTSSPS